jgi:hypothetical protein
VRFARIAVGVRERLHSRGPVGRAIAAGLRFVRGNDAASDGSVAP